MAETNNRLQSWLRLMALVLRIVLWPLRWIGRVLFPPHELDGLSPAVTAKAAQAFHTFLRQECSISSEDWSTTGFQSLKTQALEQNALVLVYLHSPLHGAAKRVATRLLGAPELLQFLQQPHLCALGVSLHSAQGAQLAQMLGAASYPLLALLQPSSTSSSSLQLVLCAQGPVLHDMGPAELVGHLNTALTRHQVHVAEQEARRLQREQEAQLRREQDAEYQETLRQDRERQRRQQEALEEERRKQEEARLEEERRQRQEEELLSRAKALVRPEPPAGGTRIRFVLPTGARLERRFGSDETIGALKAFVMLQSMDQSNGGGVNTDQGVLRNIGLSTNYPKKTYDDDTITLEEAGLSPQAVLMIQDLDA